MVMTTATHITRLLSRLDDVDETGDGKWQARCPAHEDRKPSLSIGIGHDGKVLLKCQAGCETGAVVAAVGLTMADLFLDNEKPARKSKPTIVATYDYRDENGDLLYQVCRFEPKDFRQRRPDANGGWQWSLNGVQRVLYRLPELIAANPAGIVFLVEGEKDADRLAALGQVATCNAGGAAKWRDEYNEALCGRHIAILPDNDEAGRKHANAVAKSLYGTAATVKIVDLPDLPPKGDVSDWLDAGGDIEHLGRMFRRAARWEPANTKSTSDSCDEPEIEIRGDVDEPIEDDDDPDAYKHPDPPDPAAFHGVIGDLVRLVEPHTEADPAAILIQALVTAGSVIGRGPYYKVGDTPHHLNLYAVIVGESAKARKGTSGDLVLGAFKRIEDDTVQEWLKTRRMSGLSSGEGLIHAVRDPLHKLEPIKEKGVVTAYQEVMVDPGENDKRLLVMEPEYGNVLRVIGRERNTLSAILRQGWDSGYLRTMTKNTPTKASDAHVNIIGHITVGELRHLLTTIDASNGYSNRHLWACAKRVRLLPDPTVPSDAEYRPIVQRLAQVIDAAQRIERIGRSAEAGAVWHKVYPVLSRDRFGLAGDCTSRAEAQVTRLSALFAVLDGLDVIGAEHLIAALAVWDYCERSAICIFGSATGNAAADTIRRALRAAGDDGLSRTDLRDLFERHKSKAEIEAALAVLVAAGFAERRSVATGGRPAERWFSVESRAATKAT